MDYPRISIVTPSYNQANFLETAIASVIEQDYPNLEYIIMDGGSTDGSVEIIKKYARRLTYWQSQPDGGQTRAINAGFKKATGEIFAFINSDDFFLQGAFRHIAEIFREHPDAAGWVGGAYRVVQDGFIIQAHPNNIVGRNDIANWQENAILQPGCFFSANAARAVDFFNPKYNFAFDFDFWMRITQLGKFIPTHRYVAAAMIHFSAKTQKFMFQMNEEIQAIQRAYGFETLAQDAQKNVDITRRQSQISPAAKLIYETHLMRLKHPDRYVRFPQKPADV